MAFLVEDIRCLMWAMYCTASTPTTMDAYTRTYVGGVSRWARNTPGPCWHIKSNQDTIPLGSTNVDLMPEAPFPHQNENLDAHLVSLDAITWQA